MKDWISVKTKLPKEFEDVLLFQENEGHPYIEIGYRKGEFFENFTYELNGVTHWMPLPKLPKE